MTFDEWYATQKHQLSNEQVCRVIWDAATKEEREECAKTCESFLDPDIEQNTAYADQVADGCIQQCVNAIRERSNY